jgi:hypothetical protein
MKYSTALFSRLSVHRNNGEGQNDIIISSNYLNCYIHINPFINSTCSLAGFAGQDRQSSLGLKRAVISYGICCEGFILQSDRPSTKVAADLVNMNTN